MPSWSSGDTAALLEAAGLARFQEKVAALEGDIAAAGAEQALYRRLVAALGYTANQQPFLRLADLVPLAELRTCLDQLGPSGAAERLLDWAGLGFRSIRGGMRAEDWTLVGIRPGNLPQRRVHALCHLVHRYRDAFAHTFATLVLEAHRRNRPALLVAALREPRVGPNPLAPFPVREGGDRGAVIAQRPHVPPPLAGKGPGERSGPLGAIGDARAREMAVNALLPWAFGWGELEDRAELRDAALGCFLAFPRCEENHRAREAARLLGVRRSDARTACQQQGLLHFYQHYLHDPAAWHLVAGQWRWRPLESSATLLVGGLVGRAAV